MHKIILVLAGLLVASSGIPLRAEVRAAESPVQAQMPAPPPIRYVPGLYEPLVATGPVTEQENRALDVALAAFHDAPAKAGSTGDFDDFSKPLQAFVEVHPRSNWDAALYLNLGLGFYEAGYYSRTFAYFEKSWQLGRNATSVQAKRMADRAMGELAEMYARLGRANELQSFFDDIGNRSVSGSASFMMEGAHEGLESFYHRPEIAYLCGPAALRNILLKLKAKPEQVKVAEDARSGPHGFSLSQLAALADKAGLRYSLVYRKPGQAIPVPSIINWNVHHYAAILESRDGHYRLQDPTFGAMGSVVTEKTADREGSGYFLVPAEVLAANPNSGWRTVAANSEEAHAVYGMGNTFNFFPGGCNRCTKSSPPPNSTPIPQPRMTLASIQLAVASLSLTDTPVGYKPQKGVSSQVSLTYNARDGDQPANFSFSNASPRWAHSWQAYIQDDPNNPGSNVMRVMAGGGGYDYNVLAQLSQSVYNPTTGAFVPETYDDSQLMRVPATGAVKSYTRTLQDGSVETYGLSNGATTAPRIMFLTAVSDPAGNTTTLTYDSQFRLTTITDAMGRKTTFSYSLSNFPLLITRVTDPFGRFSQLTYDSSERLASITDPIGITSSFTYGSTSEPNFVTALTTPYGTSKFSDTPDPGVSRTSYVELSLAMTDPLGNVQYAHLYQNQGATGTGSEAVVPQGMENDNPYLQWRNTYYWTPHEAAGGNVKTDANGNPTAESFADPEIYHWFHQCCTINYVSTQLGSHKRPLEKYREWYNTSPIYNTGYYSGTYDAPTFTGRVLDDGTTQLFSATFNSVGLPLANVDPVGRATQYTYASNNVDLLTVSQLTAAATYTPIATFGEYNTQHEPQTYTGADGQTWHFSYNAAGQLVTAIDPKSEITTYSYDGIGRLTSIVNANHVTALTLTYDSADRIATSTDSEGYTLAYTYDALDRVTSITYPDGTNDQYDYTFQSGAQQGHPSLEMRKHTDRLGRVTTYGYDADERLTSVTEPLAAGVTRTTSYDYYEDGTLKDITDPNGNVTHWEIDVQSRPVSKTYGYGTANAHSETYAYEATNSRLHSVTDALGQVKTFTYDHANEATALTYTNSVNSTPNVTFAYDPYFPRMVSMKDGVGSTTFQYQPAGSLGALKLALETGPYANNGVAYQYDALGRVTTRTVDTSAETFGYDALGRLVSHINPLGSFTLGYLGQTDQLTSEQSATVGTEWAYQPNVNDRRLKSITNSGIARSFQYTTNPVNDITAITESVGATPQQTVNYGYDSSDRLLTAQPSTGTSDTYNYDAADNLLSATNASGGIDASVNSLNQITSNNGNTFKYDANGNLLSDATRTYQWDAENRLIAVGYTANSTETTTFRYDGLGRRLAIVNTIGPSPSETRYLWCGDSLCQARTEADVVTRRYYPEGEVIPQGGTLLYYGKDQLGSVRDVLTAQNDSRVASYDYDAYGNQTASTGRISTDFRYAGMFYEPQSGLYLTNYRAYDPGTARWQSRDPAGSTGTPDLYSYVEGNPLSRLDSMGLQSNTYQGEPLRGECPEGIPCTTVHCGHEWLVVPTSVAGDVYNACQQPNGSIGVPPEMPTADEYECEDESQLPLTCTGLPLTSYPGVGCRVLKLCLKKMAFKSCMSKKRQQSTPAPAPPKPAPPEGGGASPPGNNYGEPGSCGTPDCLLYMK